MKNILHDSKSIHFIGIGGIGISAIARMFILEGKKISGSDILKSKATNELSILGVQIYIGHNAKNIPTDTDLVITTIAINKDNSEYIEAQKRKIKIITYPEALKEISKNKYTIAISGTHGKTTTTAMIAKIMIDAGLDPTVIVGSLMYTDYADENTTRINEDKKNTNKTKNFKQILLQVKANILWLKPVNIENLF